ncbi:MAG: penicillin-binding transpeptidase domain-containing protein [Cyanobium sp. MAG06]|nr:penicillin-binding transpeptidase domain-containing protein [Cyanobium sp. MAG06]
MDPSTGKIIAMDEYPTYNPNNKGSDFSIYINNLISSRYELGSIIKPLTMAAAIDSGSISKDDMYNDVGVRKIDDFDIGNFDRKARGVIPVSKILTDSLNIGIIHIVEKMGIEVFQEYFKKFGLGQETGIALSGEVNSLIGNIETNIKVNNVTAGFGQGIALTPIQVVRALSAIANGGILIDPYIVEKIEYTDGRVSNFPPDDGVRIISKETARAVTDMLVSIVDTKLYHKNNKDTHHSVAIKTGTAQLPKKGGGYLENEYLHSFVGYFPANNPKYLVFLFQKSPKTTAYSSDTLSPAFFKIKNFLVDYYNVPPDR